MSLPTEVAGDFTDPADEVPDAAFVTEADPAFDADPLTDATATVAPAASKMWIGAIVVVLGFILVGVGIAISDRVLGTISPVLYVGVLIIVVGTVLVFIL
jgi:protein-S-isoprenylcysteine O-methyltransferase Ste14